MVSIYWSLYPFFISPFVSSFLRAARAPIAAPQAEVGIAWPFLWIFPMFPSASIPTWGANKRIMFPSFTQWPLKAAHPVCPVNGNPPRPESGKISPHRCYNKAVMSSSQSSWLISSGHEQSQNKVLSSLKPCAIKASYIFFSVYTPVNELGKYISSAAWVRGFYWSIIVLATYGVV